MKERMIDGRWVTDPDVVAYVTDRGHLYCAACAETIQVFGAPIYFDSAPHNVEPCDRCAGFRGIAKLMAEYKEPTK